MKKIKTLSQLYLLSQNKKAVCNNSRMFRLPAAFVIHMSGVRLIMLFREGLYEYKKEKK